MLKFTVLGAFLMFAAPPLGQDKQTDTYAIIVNTGNKCAQTGATVKATIKKLFLKQMTKWPDGTAAKPYGRTQGAAEQSAFIKDVLGMGDAELARHWLKMKNMNGTTPPKGVSSDRMVIKYVEKHSGAFGVVPLAEAKAATGVKILCTF